LKKHWLWQDAEKLRWWIDILLDVNHTEKKTLIQGQLVVCGRGQSLYSLDTWAKRWRVDKSSARRFIDLLKKDGMVITENLKKTTRLTVCNYGSYNNNQHTESTQKAHRRHADGTQTTPIEERKEDNNEEEGRRIVLNVPFIDFWEMYDKKKGEKGKLEKKWQSLTDEEREKIMAYLPAYKETTLDKTYRKDPQTFLNNKSWNDELINPAQNYQNGATIRSIAPNGIKTRNPGLDELATIIKNDISQLNK
jgi:hypothetical protein